MSKEVLQGLLESWRILFTTTTHNIQSIYFIFQGKWFLYTVDKYLYEEQIY